MTARVLKGSKREIAEKLAQFAGEIHEAIVFVEDRPSATGSQEDIFSEMEPYMVQQTGVDDSREAIYKSLEEE